MRIPLHIKLMFSYVLVVGLAFLPTIVYVRTYQRHELRQQVATELVREARLLGDRLAPVPADQLAVRGRELAATLPQRLTLMSPTGEVLVDSAGRPVPNQGDRPEVQEALRTGAGSATRYSEVVDDRLLYAAVRFPAAGQVRGVLRLSVPTAAIDNTRSKGSDWVSGAAAVALSAAVLLSLVAALVVSRPLRRITDGARAFAAGDFGHPVAVDSNDELGEAARALGELAGQLRGRLLSSGADRAALHALLDDLPVGVVLFDPHGAPVVISARAREVCDLTPHLELERARQLFDAFPSEARRRVLEDGVTVETPLSIPWKSDAAFSARWIPIFAPDGARQPALVVMDDAGRRQLEVERAALVSNVVERLRSVARAHPAAAAELVVAAEALDSQTERPAPRPGEVSMVPVGALCRGVVDEVRPVGEAEGAQLETDLEEETAVVVEAGGRVHAALRSLVLQALRGCGRGQAVQLRTEAKGRYVRVVVRSPRSVPRLKGVQATLQPLGGDAGGSRDGDAFLHWVDLPRS